MDKVSCTVCAFFVNDKCVKKNVKPHIGKTRKCGLYKESDEKVQEALVRAKQFPKPETIMRPDWYWNRKEAKKEFKKQFEEEQEKRKVEAENKHPLTGDLSQWVKSTASGE